MALEKKQERKAVLVRYLGGGEMVGVMTDSEISEKSKEIGVTKVTLIPLPDLKDPKSNKEAE